MLAAAFILAVIMVNLIGFTCMLTAAGAVSVIRLAWAVLSFLAATACVIWRKLPRKVTG